MTVWNLSRLIYTVRKLAGRFDLDQMPDQAGDDRNVSVSNPSGIIDYINDFYLLDFPEHLRTLKLRDFFEFTALPNVGTYNVPNNIYQIYDPVYVDGYQCSWHQYPESFYRIWPEFNFIDRNLFTPDGSSGTSADPFVFNLTQTPIQQGTVSIGLKPNIDGSPNSPKLETFTDQDTPCLLDQPLEEQFVNPGILKGNLGSSGTIDYLTGVVNLNYITPPPLGTKSSCHYHPYVPSRPRDMMFFQQQLFLRPIPSDTYRIKLLAYVQPSVAISNLTNAGTNPVNPPPGVYSQFTPLTQSLDTQQPLFQEWWQVLAYGAAIKILIEEGDYDEAERLKGPFEENKRLAQRKCLKQLANQRIPTKYAENAQNGQAGWPIFPIY